MSLPKQFWAFPAIAALAVLVAAAAQKGGGEKRLEPAAPTGAISDRARNAAAPLWQLPLGTSFIDMMEPLEGGRLLVGLKSIARGIPNRECLAVDLSSGSVVWRLERRPRGDYALLIEEDGLLIFRVDESRRAFLLAVEAGTGRERWSARPEGGSVHFAAFPAGSEILVQSRDKKRFEASAVRLSDGATVWRRGWDMTTSGSKCPAPLIDEDGVLLFAGGVTRIDLRSGDTVWSRADVSADPDGAPPQHGGPGLLVATDETLLGLDLKSGDTVWKAPLSTFPSNIVPAGDAVYVRGDLPYSDPSGRFKIQVPPGWPLVWKSEGEEVFRFQDGQTGAFILLAHHRSASGLDQPFDGLLDIVKESLAASAARRRETRDDPVGGLPARWARYEYQAKIEGSKEKQDIVSHIGAVFDPEKRTAVGFLSWSFAEDGDDVMPVLDRAFRSIRLGEARSVADRWRQRGQISSELGHEITEFAAADGKRRWSVALAETTVSNIVVRGGRLFVATPREIYALDARTGTQVFRTLVADSGRAFPVRIDLLEDRVVFVGELVIAACDPKTGERLYSHGLTPLSQETYLAGLDNAIPQFEDMVTKLKGVRLKEGPAAGMAARATREMFRYQNLSNHYSSLLRSGRSMNPALDSMKKRFADHNAKLEATSALIFSLAEVGMMIYRAAILQKIVKFYEDILARQQLFRRSIISAYRNADLGDYVFRPHLQADADGGGTFAAVSVVHLATGRRRISVVSPSYLEYGLWNWVDVEKGILYHHGVGLDPSRYEYGDAENVGTYGKVRALKSYLIAQPVDVIR